MHRPIINTCSTWPGSVTLHLTGINEALTGCGRKGQAHASVITKSSQTVSVLTAAESVASKNYSSCSESIGPLVPATTVTLSNLTNVGDSNITHDMQL